MAVTLTVANPILLSEYAQTQPESSPTRTFVENMVAESDLMRAIPFMPVTAGRKEFLDISQTPTVAFRAINAAAPEASGTFNLREEDTFFIDEYIRVDRAVVDRLGMGHRVQQERLMSIALAQNFSSNFIKSDNTLNPSQPTGLQARCTNLGINWVHNSAASGGAALSLAQLDILKWMVNKPTHFIVPRTLMPYFATAARNNTLVNQTVAFAKDDFGREIMKYAGLPLLYGYDPDDSPDLLPMTEVASGGGSAVTGSIYCVSLRAGGLYAIEQTPLTVVDEGVLPGIPFLSTHIKWDWGIAREHPRSVARLDSIAIATIAA